MTQEDCKSNISIVYKGINTVRQSYNIKTKSKCGMETVNKQNIRCFFYDFNIETLILKLNLNIHKVISFEVISFTQWS